MMQNRGGWAKQSGKAAFVADKTPKNCEAVSYGIYKSP